MSKLLGLAATLMAIVCGCTTLVTTTATTDEEDLTSGSSPTKSNPSTAASMTSPPNRPGTAGDLGDTLAASGTDPIWPANADGRVVITACWEEPGFDSSKAYTRLVLQTTWSTIIPVDFVGWTDCTQTPNADLHIALIVEGLPNSWVGTTHRGAPSAMHLNFWSYCPTDPASCPQMIMHEFGHWLGFEHEQDRPDSTCATGVDADDKGVILLSPYDPDSIMNYCSASYWTAPHLSADDIVGARRVYGSRGPTDCAWAWPGVGCEASN